MFVECFADEAFEDCVYADGDAEAGVEFIDGFCATGDFAGDAQFDGLALEGLVGAGDFVIDLARIVSPFFQLAGERRGLEIGVFNENVEDAAFPFRKASVARDSRRLGE